MLTLFIKDVILRNIRKQLEELIKNELIYIKCEQMLEEFSNNLKLNIYCQKNSNYEYKCIVSKKKGTGDFEINKLFISENFYKIQFNQQGKGSNISKNIYNKSSDFIQVSYLIIK